MSYEQINPKDFCGPAVWHTLNCYAASYEPSPRNKAIYKKWIELTLRLFPCEICSAHAMETFKKHNIDNYLQNKDRLYLYISAILHEGANDHKHVPINERPSFYDHKKFIFQSIHGNCTTCGGGEN